MDKLDESIVSLEKALKKFGHNHIYSAVILSKMSVVYRYKGDLEKSVKFAEEAKTISDGQHGTKSHPGEFSLVICIFITILNKTILFQ